MAPNAQTDTGKRRLILTVDDGWIVLRLPAVAWFAIIMAALLPQFWSASNPDWTEIQAAVQQIGGTLVVFAAVWAKIHSVGKK